MNLEYFISKRLISTKENKNVFSRPIIRITIASIALSLSIMLISLSILLGFKKDIRDKVIGFDSHIQITSIDNNENYQPIILSDHLKKKIDNQKGVKHYQGVIYNVGLIKTKNEFMGVRFKGVDDNYDWSFFKDNMIKGGILDSNTSILISSSIASKLNKKVGDKIIVYFPVNKNGGSNFRHFYISGIYNTSMQEFDEQFAIININKLRKLDPVYDFDNSPTFEKLEISVNNFEKLKSVTDNLNKEIDQSIYKVMNIKSLHPEIFKWLDLLDGNFWFILILMFIVASVNIICSLLILILEKVKFIGILKSLGSTNYSICKIFIYNSLYICSKGFLYGNIFAFLLLFIQKRFNIIKLDPETYFMEMIPVYFNIPLLILLNLGVFIMCFFIMIIPTIIITKISPIKSIRFQ